MTRHIKFWFLSKVIKLEWSFRHQFFERISLDVKGIWVNLPPRAKREAEIIKSTYHLERSESLKWSWSNYHLERSEMLRWSGSINDLERSEKLKWSVSINPLEWIESPKKSWLTYNLEGSERLKWSGSTYHLEQNLAKIPLVSRFARGGRLSSHILQIINLTLNICIFIWDHQCLRN